MYVLLALNAIESISKKKQRCMHTQAIALYLVITDF